MVILPTHWDKGNNQNLRKYIIMAVRETFKIIDEKLTAEKARSVLVHLLLAGVEYYKLEDLGMKIRYSNHTANINNHVTELNTIIRKIIDTANQAHMENKELIVKGTIELTLSE